MKDRIKKLEVKVAQVRGAIDITKYGSWLASLFILKGILQAGWIHIQEVVGVVEWLVLTEVGSIVAGIGLHGLIIVIQMKLRSDVGNVERKLKILRGQIKGSVGEKSE